MIQVDIIQVVIKILLALLIGVVLGLNRWLHHKSAGIRTHSLVAVGSALLILMMEGFGQFDSQALSRIMQGLITGVGFLGAGVIIRIDRTQKIHGLTTAASLWVTAILGSVVGSGQYVLAMIGMMSILLVLVLGGVFEKLTGHLLGIERTSEVSGDELDGK